MVKKNKEVEELIEMAYEAEDIEETKRVAKKILEHDPNNKEALMLLADSLDEPDEQLTLLERGYDLAKKDFEALRIAEDEDPLDTDEGMIYAGVVQRLILPLVDKERLDEALKFALELRKLDPENFVDSHALYYFVLLRRKDFSLVIEETMKEEVHSLAWAWARFIAVFMLSGEGEAAERNFEEAVNLAPDVPLYMIGKYEEPVDDSESEAEDFSFALLFSEIVSSDDLLADWVISRIMEKED